MNEDRLKKKRMIPRVMHLEDHYSIISVFHREVENEKINNMFILIKEKIEKDITDKAKRKETLEYLEKIIKNLET